MSVIHEFLDIKIRIVLEQELHDYQMKGYVTASFPDGEEMKFGRSSNCFNFFSVPNPEDMEREVILGTEYLMYGLVRQLTSELDKLSDNLAMKIQKRE